MSVGLIDNKSKESQLLLRLQQVKLLIESGSSDGSDGRCGEGVQDSNLLMRRFDSVFL